jgi:hypothetical protein
MTAHRRHRLRFLTDLHRAGIGTYVVDEDRATSRPKSESLRRAHPKDESIFAL